MQHAWGPRKRGGYKLALALLLVRGRHYSWAHELTVQDFSCPPISLALQLYKKPFNDRLCCRRNLGRWFFPLDKGRCTCAHHNRCDRTAFKLTFFRSAWNRNVNDKSRKFKAIRGMSQSTMVILECEGSMQRTESGDAETVTPQKCATTYKFTPSAACTQRADGGEQRERRRDEYCTNNEKNRKRKKKLLPKFQMDFTNIVKLRRRSRIHSMSFQRN